MKHYTLFIALFLCLGINAQTCSNFALAPATQSNSYDSGDLFPNGDILTGMNVYNGLGDVLVTRHKNDGTGVWQRLLQTTDGDVDLRVSDVRVTPDGGAVVYGLRQVKDPGVAQYAYSNMFVIKLSGTGAITWARIYQRHPNSAGYPDKILPLQNGNIVFAFTVYSTSGRAWLTWLDSNGIPFRTVALAETTGTAPDLEGIVQAQNQDLILGFHHVFPGNNSTGAGVCRMDSTGAILWSGTMDFPAGENLQIESLLERNDGSILVGGFSQTPSVQNSKPGYVVLDAQGNHQSGNTYDAGFGSGAISGMYQQSSGDMIMVAGGNAELFKVASDGTPLSDYLELMDMGSPQILGGNGDTTVIAGNGGLFGGPIDGAMSVTSYDGTDFSCAFTVDGPNTRVAGPSVIGWVPFLSAAQDSIQTWTMSLVGVNPPVGVDVVAQLSNTIPRPGFQVTLAGHVCNLGTDPSGSITATLHYDTMLTYLSGTPIPTSVTGDSIVWSGLAPQSLYGFEAVTARFQITPNVALLGQPMAASFSVSQPLPEVNFANNSIDIIDTIVGAYDPNDKLVSPEGVFDVQNDSTLYYTIRFQNTGTDTAFNVVVVDTLPAEVSVGSFIPGPSSHPYTYELGADGLLTFTFANILLPDSNINEPLSHGLVSFTIEPDEGLAIGTLISNEADIFFDFNPPIRTPPAIVSYGIVTSVPVVFKNNELSVYPVPVADYLTLEKPMDFQAKQLLIYSVDGRLMQNSRADYFVERAIIPMDALTAGQYIITLVDAAGKRLSARFVKE